MIRLKTKDYLVNVEIRFSVTDLTELEREQRSEAIRQECIRLQKKRLAGITAARKAEQKKE